MKHLEQVRKELIRNQRCGYLFVKQFRFDEIAIYSNQRGEVTDEVPRTRYATLVCHGRQKQGIWLSEDELRSLVGMLDRLDEEERSEAPQVTCEAMER